MDATRLAYLDALGIDVWVPREPRAPAEPEREAGGPVLVLGTGDGDILCVVASPEEAGLDLVGDIGRAMRSAPVWAWPAGAPGFGAEAVSLEEAVADRLFTRMLVFGEGVASVLFGARRPDSLGTAGVHFVPGVARLGTDREAKRILWALMQKHGIAAGRAAGQGSG